MKTSIPPLLTTFAVICFALVQKTQAADGGLGNGNTAEGHGALESLTTGDHNTAIGARALNSLTTGSQNTATGSQALVRNKSNFNTAVGFAALDTNTTGSSNVAVGDHAIGDNIEGGLNTAIGSSALPHNRTGSRNTAVGSFALENNTTGAGNIALGYDSGSNLTTGHSNIDIGNTGVAGESSTIRIGNSSHARTFIAGISGSTIAGTTVEVNAEGQLGVSPSSARFKDNIKPMGKASEGLYELKPVAFRYKKEIDAASTSQFGLVAEEVEKVNPDLVVRDEKGKPYSVRYEQVNAMLLNEFLKEHRKVQEQEAIIAQVKSNAAKQEATIGELKSGIQALTAKVKEQAAQIQTVSAQLDAASPSGGGLEASKFATGRIRDGGPAPQVVNNP